MRRGLPIGNPLSFENIFLAYVKQRLTGIIYIFVKYAI